MEVSANVRRTEPTPRREQDGETYSAATRSRSTSTQPIAAPSTATHTSCSRIARATRSAAPRVAHLSACSLDIAGTASARIARRRMLASASSSAASARRICIKSLPRSLTPRISRPPDRRQICACKFDDWLVGRLHAFVRRRRSGTVYGPPRAVQVELRSVRTHVPEALLQNRARILIRFDRAKIARERAKLCADALELLRIRNKSRDLLPVPQRARPAEQRSRSCMRELRNFEIEERAPVARPAPAHAGPAQASLQDAEGQDLEILVVRARFLAGKAAAALLLCERTLPGRAMAHPIFRHMNDEDGTLRRLTGIRLQDRQVCIRRQTLRGSAAYRGAGCRRARHHGPLLSRVER